MEHVTQKSKGLKLGAKAPAVNLPDVFGHPVDSDQILVNHRGLFVDFFRGSW
ncbi:MAG TPA: hypothetical protein VKK79_21745 [Candidatus Lokiarchaeia archaeon]|nr:hypothetical protein [Candidatus Lokiarchaeia archaeon]